MSATRTVKWGTLVKRRGRWCQKHYGVVVGSRKSRVVVVDHNGEEHLVSPGKLRDVDPEVYYILQKGGYFE